MLTGAVCRLPRRGLGRDSEHQEIIGLVKKLLLIGLALLLCPLFLAAQADAVVFSRPGGFYDNSFSLELSCSDACHIRYTTNGATPTAHSRLYENPLWMDGNLYSSSDIYKKS